jgi:uncharacterized protein (DUF1015 family)
VADVRPFRGIRYSIERIPDVSSVISPPYDVISPEEQGFYYQQSPCNVVRLELGEDLPSDSPESNRCTRAAETLRNWLDEGILLREQAPAFYVFQHRFVHQGLLRSRWGLVARVRLEGDGVSGARPHEVIMESRVRDRLNLLRCCGVNFSSILGMVRHDGQGLASLLPRLVGPVPDVSAVDRQGVIHNMWVVSDEECIALISEECADKVVYIADGHHRYETALAYQRERRAESASGSGEEPHDFVMMTLADAGDPGMFALPAHRLVRLAGSEGLSQLRDKLNPLFEVEYLEPAGNNPDDALDSWLGTLEGRGAEGTAIGVYGLHGDRLGLLTPRETAEVEAMLPGERSQEWKNLDVALLHWVILRQIAGLDTAQEEECVAYTGDGREATSRVDSGEFQLAFFMNAIPISSVLAVADAGDRMPPKSTYFYPKLPTGMVMYPLWEE